MPATGEATADFATALSAAAIASGATETLGAIAVKSATVAPSAAPSTETTVVEGLESLPATGSTDILPVMWFAIFLLLVGSLIALRRRNFA